MLIIPSLKYKTKHKKILSLGDADKYYLPLSSYKGEMSSIVEMKSSVKQYQKIAQSEGFFSTCIHAPVSGIITEKVVIDGKSYLVLENDFKEDDAVGMKKLDLNTLTPEMIVDRIREAGIEGSGGAQFPTYLKLRSTQKIEFLIINGVECEPYLSADYVLMKERMDEILKGISIIQQLINANEIVFGIEKQNRDLKSLIEQKGKEMNLPVHVKLVHDSYPQGGELQLIKSVTQKEIRKGSIPADYGIIVHNVGTLWAIFNAFFHGKPATDRIVTISGNNRMEIGNYLLKIGTPVEHILKETNNSWNPEQQTLILGGAMMGKTVHSSKTPINKGSGGLLILKNSVSSQNNCIACGYCVDVCPQHLMPMEFARYSEDIEQLSEFNLQDCIECGACAYSCPSDVPLMQSIVNGKSLIR